MTITLPSEVESRVQREALRRGVPAEVLIRTLLDQGLPGPVSGDEVPSDVALLERVRFEDFTDDPGELARRQRETDELLGALHRDRYGMG